MKPKAATTKRHAARAACLLAAWWLSLVLTGCERAAPPGTADAASQAEAARAAAAADPAAALPVAEFVARHWREPIAPQGVPPAGWTPEEASLAPADCARCHPAQWADWKGSLHAQAMGPGIAWQLHLMDAAAANRCLRCHAPLAEQKALVALDHRWPSAPKEPPPAYVGRTLHREGLVCAACHVRGHRRYGPPAAAPGAPTSAAPPAAPSLRPHGGFVASVAFGDAAFCAPCHQFPADGPRTAGKLHEDTVEQWRASAFAPSLPCQGCHMPGRRHLWRGIHDAAMTRQAIAVDLELVRLSPGRYEARADVRNVGAGHHFPTYMVPKVELIFVRVPAPAAGAAAESASASVAARAAPGAAAAAQEIGRHTIGWSVDTRLTRELADTRIPAGASARFAVPFAAPAPRRGALWAIELRIVVRPGEHYERTFRESLAQAERLPPAAVPVLREALARVQAAEYELLRVARIAN